MDKKVFHDMKVKNYMDRRLKIKVIDFVEISEDHQMKKELKVELKQ